MFLIAGINHLRAIGISEGKAFDFNPENYGGYRSPQTEEEKKACISKALEYYNSCYPSVRTGDFGIVPVSEQTVEEIGNLLAAETLAEYEGIDLADYLSRFQTCEYCGKMFFPESPSQKVCKSDECQKKRKSKKALDYYYRNKSK